jgi:hypothetical protein
MKLGALDISTVKLGTNQVQAVYQGANLVWQNAPVATAATGVGQTSFTANWNAYSGATYYLLDVSESSDFSTFVYENQITTSTSYVVIGLNSNTTYYYRVRANVGYDSDAQAFFDRVADAEGSLSTTEQAAVNQLVLDLKANSIWTPMKAIYPMVGASAAACAQNLKSASFTGTFTSGGSYSSSGYNGNGVAHMDTNYNVNTNGSLNSAHLSIYSRTNNSGSFVDFGANPQSHFLTYNFGNYSSINSSDTPAFSSLSTSDGFFIGSRTSSTEARFFHKGGSAIVSSRSSTSMPNLNLYLGGLNNSGNRAFATSRQYAFASIGDGLTDLEAGYFYNAVQTFQTTLSRQV